MFNTDYVVEVYLKEDLISKIFVNNHNVTFENYIKNPLWLPFGIKKTVTLNDLEEFYEERCFPRERVNCKELLRDLGLDCYEPELICRKTHGVQFDDFLWLQFSDEKKVTYQEIKLRN